MSSFYKNTISCLPLLHVRVINDPIHLWLAFPNLIKFVSVILGILKTCNNKKGIFDTPPFVPDQQKLVKICFHQESLPKKTYVFLTLSKSGLDTCPHPFLDTSWVNFACEPACLAEAAFPQKFLNGFQPNKKTVLDENEAHKKIKTCLNHSRKYFLITETNFINLISQLLHFISGKNIKREHKLILIGLRCLPQVCPFFMLCPIGFKHLYD